MTQQKIYCLRNVHLFEGVGNDELMQATKCIDTWTDQATVIYTPETVNHRVYMLKQGEVELVSDNTSKKVVIDTLLPGDLFGDFGFGGQIKHLAVAKRRSMICEFKTEEFLKTLREVPAVSFNLLRSLAERTLDYEDRIVSLQQPAKIRLLKELALLQVKHDNSIHAKRFKVPLRLSHQVLADKTGLNRVTVTKILGELKRDGVLKIDDQTGAFEIV